MLLRLLFADVRVHWCYGEDPRSGIFPGIWCDFAEDCHANGQPRKVTAGSENSSVHFRRRAGVWRRDCREVLPSIHANNLPELLWFGLWHPTSCRLWDWSCCHERWSTLHGVLQRSHRTSHQVRHDMKWHNTTTTTVSPRLLLPSGYHSIHFPLFVAYEILYFSLVRLSLLTPFHLVGLSPTCIHPRLISTPNTSDVESASVTDNAVSALGRLCEFQSDCIDTAKLLPLWLSYLPFKVDVEEVSCVKCHFSTILTIVICTNFRICITIACISMRMFDFMSINESTQHPRQSVTIRVASHIEEFDKGRWLMLAFKLESFNPNHLESSIAINVSKYVYHG